MDRSVSEKEEKAHPVHRAAMSSSSESEWLLVRERKESPLEGKNEGEGGGGEGGVVEGRVMRVRFDRLGEGKQTDFFRRRSLQVGLI